MEDFIPERSPDPILTIGNFDGLHLGHRALIEELCSLCGKYEGTPVAMTFAPHPKAILTGTHPHRISTVRDKVKCLEEMGVKSLIIQLFDWQLAATEPEEFVRQLLGAIHPRAVLLGYDFRFGARGRGTVELFRQLAGKEGVEVVQATACQVDGEVVSSSGIRDYLAHGNLEAAEHLLGHPYTVTGKIMHGAGRGKTINIPTANLQPLQDLFLPTGIYAGALIAIDETRQWLPVAISLGYNPTFEQARPTPSFEVHIVDFEADLYGREIRVALFKRLRGEIRYEQVEALVAQIRRDIRDSSELFANRTAPLG